MLFCVTCLFAFVSQILAESSEASESQSASAGTIQVVGQANLFPEIFAVDVVYTGPDTLVDSIYLEITYPSHISFVNLEPMTPGTQLREIISSCDYAASRGNCSGIIGGKLLVTTPGHHIELYNSEPIASFLMTFCDFYWPSTCCAPELSIDLHGGSGANYMYDTLGNLMNPTIAARQGVFSVISPDSIDGYPDTYTRPIDKDCDGIRVSTPPEPFFPNDNCPEYYNPDQADADGDSVGNVCDLSYSVSPGTNVSVDFQNGVVVTFAQVDVGGQVTFTNSCACQASRFAEPDIYYNIASDAVFSGDIEMCITYSVDTLSPEVESALEMRLTQGMSTTTLPTSVDTAQNVICGTSAALGAFSISTGVGPGCCILRGDVDHDGTRNIADLTYLVSWSFRGGPDPACPQEADCNGDGNVDISDLTCWVAWSFKSGPEPTSCF